MSKLEWFWICTLNSAALLYLETHGDTPEFWRWHHSKQMANWIGHADGPNRHPGGWQKWMEEWGS